MRPSLKLIAFALLASLCTVSAIVSVKHTSSLKEESIISTNVYYGSNFSINLGDYFHTSAASFEVYNTTHVDIHNVGTIDVSFTLPEAYLNSSVESFSVIPRHQNNKLEPTIFIGFNNQIVEFACNRPTNSSDLICPSTPKVHDIPNIVSISSDSDRNLTIIHFHNAELKTSYAQIVNGDNITDVLKNVTLNEPCSKFIFAPKIAQFLCVRQSGAALDAYGYYDDGKELFTETYSAESQNVKSIDDFIIPDKYQDNGIIRCGADLTFVRNEVNTTLKDPFGDNSSDYELYSYELDLILVNRRLNKIRQYDFSSISNIRFDGEYNLHNCSLTSESKIGVSNDIAHLYVTCQASENSSFLYIYNINSRDLRQAESAVSIDRKVFNYGFFEDQNTHTDTFIAFDSPILHCRYIYDIPALSGSTDGFRPIDETNVAVMSYQVEANSTINETERDIKKAEIVVIFPERPINPVNKEINLTAVRENSGLYSAKFLSHDLFTGSVHNFTFEELPLNDAQKKNLNEDTKKFRYVPSTDYLSNISVPNVSDTETVYDYHYLPIKPSKSQKVNENDGVFILLTTESQTKAASMLVYHVTRDEDNAEFKNIKFHQRIPVSNGSFCSTLTLLSMGEFGLENLFGFVQCQSKKDQNMALYGFALKNGTQVMNQVIDSSEAFINFAFDDVLGHIVVFHASADQTDSFIEFHKFYPLNENHINPVKSISKKSLGFSLKGFETSAYDLTVNLNSQTYELYTISQRGILVYCSTPIEQKKGYVTVNSNVGEFCVMKNISSLVGLDNSVSVPAWTGLQIIKDYSKLSAEYNTNFMYSNGLKFVINANTFNAYMIEVTQSTFGDAAQNKATTQFNILKGFAGYHPDYRKLTFFDVDEQYLVFVANAGVNNDEFVYIVYDHTLNETNSDHYHTYNGTFSPYVVLEATAGYRYHSADVGMAATRIFLEDPLTFTRRLITLGSNNTLIQHYLNQYHYITVLGECEPLRLNMTARNDHFEASTIINIQCE